jgi:hypothetical protein
MNPVFFLFLNNKNSFLMSIELYFFNLNKVDILMGTMPMSKLTTGFIISFVIFKYSFVKFVFLERISPGLTHLKLNKHSLLYYNKALFCHYP